MGTLSFPSKSTRTAQWFGRKPRTLKAGEKFVEVFDVYQIIKDADGKVIEHRRVYRGYTDLDRALAAKDGLQVETSDHCYVVGHKFRRKTKVGTR